MTFSVKDAIFYKKLCWNWFQQVRVWHAQQNFPPVFLSTASRHELLHSVFCYTHTLVSIHWPIYVGRGTIVLWYDLLSPCLAKVSGGHQPLTIHTPARSTWSAGESAPCTGQRQHPALVNLSTLHWSTSASCTGQPQHPALVNANWKQCTSLRKVGRRIGQHRVKATSIKVKLTLPTWRSGIMLSPASGLSKHHFWETAKSRIKITAREKKDC